MGGTVVYGGAWAGFSRTGCSPSDTSKAVHMQRWVGERHDTHRSGNRPVVHRHGPGHQQAKVQGNAKHVSSSVTATAHRVGRSSRWVLTTGRDRLRLGDRSPPGVAQNLAPRRCTLTKPAVLRATKTGASDADADHRRTVTPTARRRRPPTGSPEMGTPGTNTAPSGSRTPRGPHGHNNA